MFTGIVQDVGRIERHEARGGDLRLVIRCDRLDVRRLALGDSIAVQGCCLTVVEQAAPSFAVDVSRETLALTTLGQLAAGAAVNLEPALRAGDALGGHLVSGHVDGVAQVLSISAEARSQRVVFGVPVKLERFLAPKGSVCVDGVSLTVNEVGAASFGVNLIPHTQAVTTLGALSAGTRVNIEVDQLARYLARLLAVPTTP
ncbi:MAG TPA: riboflavin synthase [Steroidobacteraceae bacterium]|nr:riboflavin synthase [Steroidobacteraceae bacterium]